MYIAFIECLIILFCFRFTPFKLVVELIRKRVFLLICEVFSRLRGMCVISLESTSLNLFICKRSSCFAIGFCITLWQKFRSICLKVHTLPVIFKQVVDSSSSDWQTQQKSLSNSTGVKHTCRLFLGENGICFGGHPRN